jgi:RimJ/RimL family protein N-acetyltransferase
MLRGWNEGYEVPAFGILIDAQCRGYGLEMAALDTAKVICRLRKVPRLMIKMHPENISARGVARKTGFTQTGVEVESGNLIYHYELKARAGVAAE